MGVMVLTLIVGWLVVSVLFALLWSLVVRGSHARHAQPDDAPYDVPNFATGATDTPVRQSPRRSWEGMAESSW